MICFRYEEVNQQSFRMLFEEDEDIQNRVSNEEKEEYKKQYVLGLPRILICLYPFFPPKHKF